MSLALAEPTLMTQPPASSAPASPRPLLSAAIDAACARIAPLWPLSNFVAVNPFLGFAAKPFATTAHELRRLTGTPLVMPRTFYRQAIHSGRISAADLEAGLAAMPALGLSQENLMAALDAAPAALYRADRVATVADVLDSLADGDRQVSRTAFMVDEISKWCAAYFDEGQAMWPAPWRKLPLFDAWRFSMQFDGNARAMGIKGLAATIAALPADPEQAIAAVLGRLEIPEDQWSDYLFRALFDVRGWAAFVRRLDWEAERAGKAGGRLTAFLAIRVVWGYGLFRQRQDETFLAAWRAALATSQNARAPAAPDKDLAIDLVLQRAYEHHVQEALIQDLSARAARRPLRRPNLQAVFCIDVRSEVYRRALEATWPGAETLGFAGFFGMPIAYGESDHAKTPHCPVLLEPSVTVHGRPLQRSPGAGLAAACLAAWSTLKTSAVSCFGFVEALGLAYGVKLAKAAFAPAAWTPPPDRSLRAEHLDLAARIRLAEGALRGMSLVSGFARVVMLVGHGATSANNPHAAGLDCGACGGHSGAPNARLAALLLNDPEVRWGLVSKGIVIPRDTLFVPALHDTTTDAISLLDETAPITHAADLNELRRRLEGASRIARAERATLLGLSPLESGQVFARSQDWSQVRPEWGLARAAAFIAAPRALTAGRNLQGRAFLHSYDRREDPDLKTLELILTAPMVVASWISLQYYGSTVDNVTLGAGDKTLHNVCGQVGVLEGNGGDLRVGLPLQSLHDGERFVHEPLRLSVFLAAPPEAISQVLAKHQPVRDLVDNGWLFVFSMNDDGKTTHRYAGDFNWETLS